MMKKKEKSMLEAVNFGFILLSLFVQILFYNLVGLTLFAGLMSGLTVGLLSIDKMELETKQLIGTE